MPESKNNLHSAVGSLLSQLCGGRFSRSASCSYRSGFSYSALDSFSNLVFFWDVDVPTFVSDVSVSIAIAIRDMRCRDVSHNTDRYNVAASTASTNCTKPLQHHRRKQQHNSYLIRACARARAHGLLTSHTFH